jgi:hypothetical protein
MTVQHNKRKYVKVLTCAMHVIAILVMATAAAITIFAIVDGYMNISKVTIPVTYNMNK